MNRIDLKSFVICSALVSLGLTSAAMAQNETPEKPIVLSFDSLDDEPAPLEYPSAPATSEPTYIQADTSSNWRFEANTWIWMVGFTGDITARGRTANVDANFADVLDGSDSIVALSGRIELGYGKFAAYIDGMYSDLGADDQSGPGGLADIDVTLKQGLVDFGLMYRIIDEEPNGAAAANPRNMTLDLYAGARYNAIEIELDPANLESRSTDRNWIDPVIGAKFGLPLSEDWHFKVNGDIGGFGIESDFTWSATAVFGYDFQIFGLPATIQAGYRAIGWDYSEGSGNDEFVFDITQHGPILGLSIRF